MATHFFRLLLTLLLFTYFLGCSDSEAPEFAFGVITDVHYCDHQSDGSRHFRSSLKKLKECVNELNSKGLAFTIQLGDFIDRDYESFNKVLPIFDRLNMPKYHVLGNHEFSVANEMKSAVPAKVGLEKGYYDFALKGWRFVVLNGTDIHLKRTPKGSEQYQFAKQMYDELRKQKLPNAQKWNGALGKSQITWLKATLEKACQAGEKVILFCHFPIYPQGMHSLWNDIEVLNVIESYDCIIAYVNGHDHSGYYKARSGIHHLNLKGMVETPDENSYAVFEVFPNYLKVIGYGREPDRILNFEHAVAIRN
ncbi:MAG: metallophosphoesterase [bacterium]